MANASSTEVANAKVLLAHYTCSTETRNKPASQVSGTPGRGTESLGRRGSPKSATSSEPPASDAGRRRRAPLHHVPPWPYDGCCC
jgi:hypothetical protein